VECLLTNFTYTGVKLNFLQLASFNESMLGNHQHGWIDPDPNNIFWNYSSFSNPQVDIKYIGGIVSHGKPLISRGRYGGSESVLFKHE
jgi:hypothetical protein